MKNIIVVDIDGTIAMIGDRLKYLQQQKKDWDSFYEHCDEDEPIYDVIEMARILANCDGEKLVFCTGRRESVREKTRKWINNHVPLRPSYQLLMRPDGDYRHDTMVKPELLAAAGYTPKRVFCILEDRDSMVAKWRELGYRCLQVADGKF